VFEYPSATAAKVLIIGKTANLKIFPNKTSSAYLTLKFNRIEELDASGRGVYGHAITSLSGLTPAYSTGALDGAGGRVGQGARLVSVRWVPGAPGAASSPRRASRRGRGRCSCAAVV
jgi:hypothetical protein